MIELRRHIEILLLSNDCVIVPNLGGFMAHHVSSRYDTTDNMMLPPLRTVGFNPKLNMNDSLLAQSYADAHDISYPEAVIQMEHDINILKRHLEEKGSFELAGIGTLIVNDSGNYEFEPLEAGILTPNLYGFGAIEIPQLHVSSNEKHVRESSVVMPLFSSAQNSKLNSSQPCLATIMSNIDNNAPQTEEKTISIKVSVLRNLAVTAVAAVALVLFARPVAPDEASSSESAKAEAGVLSIPTQNEEISSKSINILGSLDVVSQKLEISKKATVEPTVGQFTIVLGCSLPLENAKSFLSQVQSKGAKEAILWNYKSDNMIVYGSYSSSEEALPKLREFASNGISGWILEVK